METSPFKDGWHIGVICEHLEAVTAGQIRRLIINIPPRHMKSLTTCVFWPAWEWLQKPGTRFLFSSYAHQLSIRDSVKCRRVVQSPQYQRILMGETGDASPFELTTDQNTKIRFENDEGGYRLATSVDGALTGEGGDKIIVDDPHNVIERESETARQGVMDWWDNSMVTRLNDEKTGGIVIIQQRVHQGDLSGHVQELDPGEWELLVMPARYEGENRISTSLGTKDVRRTIDEPLWPERYDDGDLARIERALGSYGRASQLQQRPAPREGGIIHSEWFSIVERAPARVDRRVRFWDLACTKKKADTDPDWTAGAMVSVRAGVYTIEEIARVRDTPLAVERLVAHCAETDPEGTEWCMEEEGGASGKSLISHYARHILPGKNFHGIRSTGSKETYVEPLAAGAEAGNVHVVRGAWNRVFFDECDNFPNAKHDDTLDAVAKAHARLGGKPNRAGIWGVAR